MTRDLFLFDVSPFIHAGSVNKFARLEQTICTGVTWQTMRVPCGGISLIFNELYAVVGKGDCVFCTDRNPTIKKDMYSGYKANRDHNDYIQISKTVAEYILEKCGGTVIARAGYEADDIIYTLVRRLHDQYDNIYIYTGDSDLYFLVDKKVSIRPSNSRAKSVDYYNYNSVLAKYGAKYNSLTVQKILKGDTSDCIPALPRDAQNKLASVLFQDAMLPQLGDKSFVRSWVSTVCPEALPQVDLVFPLDVDDIPLEFSQMDPYLIRNFGCSMHNKMFRDFGDPNFMVEPYVSELIQKGCYLEDTQ